MTGLETKPQLRTRDRLETLIAAGVLTREDSGGNPEYLLTEGGRALWPTIFALSKWGERYTSGPHPSRIFSHTACDTDIDDFGRCRACGQIPAPTTSSSALVPAPTRCTAAIESPAPLRTPTGC
ncbi:winged helix-turn-helix transcriptional regulator [Saccharopolyspora hattusasensis]|uniref:winged helix-turn-helix transcriptional regulator n=1 Tax=Saccharopolyspora hattusasensis TaxID=1128679 RepID=UPI003D9817FE